MSALEPIEAVQLSARTFDSIEQAIITGQLRGGEVLRDSGLAETLRISRTPVREALQRLRHVGLVESRGRSGWVVAKFTEQDIRELFQLRRALEPLGIDELQKDPQDAAVYELSTFFETYRHPVPKSRYPEYFAHDHAFHKKIVACSRNSRLVRFYGVIESHIDRGRHFLSAGSAGRVDANLDEHEEITRALAASDFTRARAALLHHLNMGEQLMIDYLRRLDDDC